MEKVQSIETGIGGHWANDNLLTRNEGNRTLDFFVKSLKEEIEILDHEDSTRSEGIKMDLDTYKLINYNSKFNITAGRKYSNSTQKWIGFVSEVTNETFKAKLIDKTRGGTYEDAEFNIDEISPDDLPLLRPNAIFYWSIGFEMTNGQRRAESILKFKRTIVLESQYYNKGYNIGADLFEGLDWED